jgi:hypothetical protein
MADKRYILKYPGVGDMRVDAYIACGSIIEAVSIHDDGIGFDHISMPADCIIIDQTPPMSLADFLLEEVECEERVKNVRKTRKQIQEMADKEIEELPKKMMAETPPEYEPEGYR